VQSPVGNLIFIFVLFIVFYFFLIRPQKKRMEAQRSLIESVEEGDEIVTMGGIVGTVQSLEDDEMRLEVAPGTSIRILRSAVARKVVEEDLDDEDDEDLAAEEEEQA
jgi:preprotein translocase subunit YajC